MRIPLVHEEAAQALVMARLAFVGVDAFHVPNESIGGVRYRAKRKTLGVRKGVPDIVVITPPPCGGYVGAAIELKRERGGRASKEQLAWLDKFAAAGWATAVAHGSEEALSVLRGWGYAV